MRELCAAGLTVLLCAQPLLAEGPLERSVEREASRLAVEPPGAAGTSGWRAVRDFTPGRLIMITTMTATTTRTFVSADDSTLTVTHGSVVERLAMDDVLVVTTGTMRHGSALAAVGGTLAGLWLGSGLAYGLAENARCHDGCGGVQFAMLTAMIGLPIMGGMGAWLLTSRFREDVIYRRL